MDTWDRNLAGSSYSHTTTPMELDTPTEGGDLKIRLKLPKLEKKKNKTFRLRAKMVFLTYSATGQCPDSVWKALSDRATVAKPLR